jgi:hypothetical protein
MLRSVAIFRACQRLLKGMTAIGQTRLWITGPRPAGMSSVMSFTTEMRVLEDARR